VYFTGESDWSIMLAQFTQETNRMLSPGLETKRRSTSREAGQPMSATPAKQ